MQMRRSRNTYWLDLDVFEADRPVAQDPAGDGSQAEVAG